MAKANPIRFSTQFADDITGDLKYLFRDYQAPVGRWLSRDPIGELGGQNQYVLARNELLHLIDNLGLYELQFDLTDGFTKDQKKKVNDVIDTVGKRAKALLPQFDSEIKRLKSIPCPEKCVQDLIKGLEKAKSVAKQIADGAASKSENLEVEKKNLGTDSARLFAIYVGDSTLIWYDPILQLNTNPKNYWETSSDLPETVLHELSHKYGTEDHDGEGPYNNAYNFEQLYNNDVNRWPEYNDRLRKCDTDLMPPKK